MGRCTLFLVNWTALVFAVFALSACQLNYSELESQESDIISGKIEGYSAAGSSGFGSSKDRPAVQ